MKKNLPKTSQVGIAAIRNLDGYGEAEALVSMLCEFDKEIEIIGNFQNP
ncbi:MAG: hypothetical protein JSS58_03215 [Proteobacteria bacterium]|nr:hypothetical protein [Pseudomonadota bacterium]